jgi:hypothetical protein
VDPTFCHVAAGRPSSSGAFQGLILVIARWISSMVISGFAIGSPQPRSCSDSMLFGSGGKNVFNRFSAISSFPLVLPPWDFCKGGTRERAEDLLGSRYLQAVHMLPSSARKFSQ